MSDREPNERNTASAAATAPLAVGLSLTGDRAEAVVHREPVTWADLGDVLAEAWWWFAVAHPGRARADARLALALIGEDADRHLAVDVAVGTARRRVEFARDALGPVLQRGLAALRARDDGAPLAEMASVLLAVAPMPIVRGQDVLAGPEPAWLAIDSRCLTGVDVANGRESGDTDCMPVPVLYAESARCRAEQLARAGQHPVDPVETGGVLLGHVARCTHTQRVFLLVEDVLPAGATNAAKYSLEYTPATWQRIRAVLRARQRVAPTLRIIGQVHGHNFTPEGEPCAECRQRAVCTRSTAFLSTSDREWCRAVFPMTPWQLSQVFGWNARGEPDETFQGVWRGCLRARPYVRIADDDYARLLPQAQENPS